jgi:hypothetical protein
MARIQELADEIALTQAHMNAAGWRQLTALREFDARKGWFEQGARTCAGWVSWRVGQPRKTAAGRLYVARKLASLPLIDDAFRRGVLCYSQVRALVRIATPENEALLLQYARGATGEVLSRIVTHVRQQLAVTEHPDLSHLLSLAFSLNEDGTTTLRARMRPEQARVVETAIRVQQEEARVRVDPDGPMTTAELKERRDDKVSALVGVCERYLDDRQKREADHVVPGKHEVIVVMDLDTLRSTGDAPVSRCTLADGTPISPEAARRIACDCPLVPAILAPDGEPIDVGRRRRSIPPALRRALLLRDGDRCQYPGCNAKGYVDAHHVKHWAHGGETKLENLVTLCRRHHVRVHEGGEQILVTEDGQHVFLDREGRPIPTGPIAIDLGDEGFERLKAANARAELVITPRTNQTTYEGAGRRTISDAIGFILERTPGSAWFRPNLAFDAFGVTEAETRERARQAPWFEAAVEEGWFPWAKEVTAA